MTPMAPPTGDKPQGGSTLWMFVLLAAAMFIMFDENLRNLLSAGVGFVFMPLFGFGGEYPVWTIFAVGLVMVAASTLVRHFFVDWAAMARSQEVMRHYQKELKSAKDSNNTYKMKRLGEAQPDILKMQADLSGGQMKPMIITMIVVIPLFTWVAAFVSTPVEYTMPEDASTTILVAMDGQPAIASSYNSLRMHTGADIYAIPVGATPSEDLTLQRQFPDRAPRQGPTFATSGHAPLDLAPYKVADLPAGDYRIRISGDADGVGLGHYDRVVVYARGPTTSDAFVADYIEGKPRNYQENVTLYAFLPVKAAAPLGAGQYQHNGFNLNVVDAASGNLTTKFITHEHTLGIYAFPHARVVPHSANVPWEREWDLNKNIQWDFLFLGHIPRWIALYSLFSIPFGQALQKALKMWEYRRKPLHGAAA